MTGVVDLLARGVREGLSEEVTWSLQTSGGRVFRAVGTASAKALRQEGLW